MAHWHGNTVTWNNVRMDTLFLGPMAMASADMIPDSEGMWLFHCHVTDHYAGGMIARYQVLPKSRQNDVANRCKSSRDIVES